jgi:outer membrane protein OmpA-like peptidoglycan-associated protein
LKELQTAATAIFNVCIMYGMAPVHLRIEGHVHLTDNVKKCWLLSGERAKLVAMAVRRAGVPAVTLHPKGFGPSR